MRLLRGKNKGLHLTPHQYCNDWISANTDDGRPLIVGPTQVELDPEDAEFFKPGDQRAGTFWLEFQLVDNRFRRINGRGRRS